MAVDWYQCPACLVLIQNIHEFIVHKNKHGFRGKEHHNDDPAFNETQQLFSPQEGMYYSLDELPLQATTVVFTPRIQLSHFPETCARFVVQIESPIIVLPFIDVETDPFDLPINENIAESIIDKSTNEERMLKLNGCRSVPYRFCNHVSSNEALKRHESCARTSTGSFHRSFRCPILTCEQSTGFSTPADIWSHLDTFHQSQPISECKKCQRRFRTMADYRFHLTQKICSSNSNLHADDIGDILTNALKDGQEETPIMVKCDYCNHPTRKCLNRHLLTCNQKNDVRFLCPFRTCPSRLNVATDISAHFESCHSGITNDLRTEFGLKLQAAVKTIKTALYSRSIENVSGFFSKLHCFSTTREPRKRRRMKECPACGVFMLNTNLARHMKHCKTKRKRLLRPAENSSGTQSTDACLSNTVLNGSVTENKTWRRNMKPKIKTEPPFSCTDGDVDNAGDDLMPILQREDLPAHEISDKALVDRHSKNQTIRGKNSKKTMRKIKMRFLTRCGYCHAQTCSSNLARHLGRCNARKKLIIGTVLTHEQQDETNLGLLESTAHHEGLVNDVVAQLPVRINMRSSSFVTPKIETNEHVSPINPAIKKESILIESVNKGESKFRPRSKCPVCGSIQVTGNLEAHLKICNSTNLEHQITTTNGGGTKTVVPTVSPEETLLKGDTLSAPLPREILNIKYSRSHHNRRLSRYQRKWKNRLSKCQTCGHILRNGNMARHLKEACKRRSQFELKCTKAGCSTRVSSPKHLKIHEQIYHQGRRLHSCVYCQKTYASARSLRRHFIGNVCGQELLKETELMSNPAKRSPIVRPMSDCQSPPTCIFKTPAFPGEVGPVSYTITEGIALQPTTKRSTLKTTGKVVRKRNWGYAACRSCGALVFASNMSRHLKGTCPGKVSNLGLQCPKSGCSSRVLNSRALKAHMQMYHRKELVHSCEYCCKPFATAIRLTSHVKICDMKLLENEQVIEEDGHSISVKVTATTGNTAYLATPSRCGGTCSPIAIPKIPVPSAVEDVASNERTTCCSCDTVIFQRYMAKHLQTCKRRTRKSSNNANIPPATEKTSLFVCECEGCDSLFSSNTELEQHIDKYHVQKTDFTCYTCGTNFFETQYEIEHHNKLCSSNHYRQHRLRKNVRSSKPLDAIPAIAFGIRKSEKEIQQGSASSPMKKRLVSTKTNSRSKGRSTLTKKVLKCDYCGKLLISESGLRRHLRKCNGRELQECQDQWNCIFCLMGFESPTALADHIRNTCHPKRREQKVQEDPLLDTVYVNDCKTPSETTMECGYCHKKFVNRDNLMHHFKTPCTINSSSEAAQIQVIKLDPCEERPHTLANEKGTSLKANGVVIKMEEDFMIEDIIGSTKDNISAI